MSMMFIKVLRILNLKRDKEETADDAEEDADNSSGSDDGKSTDK